MIELWSFIGSNAAEIIACCAFFLAVWQGFVTRHHNKLSVTPQLVFETTVQAKPRQVSVHLNNSGIGPAEVISFKYFFDGKDLDSSELDVMFEYIGESFYNGKELEAGGGVFRVGQYLSVGSRCLLFYVQTDPSLDETLNHQELIKNLKRLQIEVEYKSLYGKKYFKSLNNS